MCRVITVVLAAGRSRRMGRTKQLLPYGSATMIECMLTEATASIADQTLVVLGHDAERIRPVIERFGVATCTNPMTRDDMVGSVCCALDWMGLLPAKPDGFLLCLADQPDIPTGAHNAVLAEFRAQPTGIVVATHAGRRGHPTIFSLDYEDDIRELSPSQGLNMLLHRHPEAVRQATVSDAAVLCDLDRPEDLRR
jgi:molybdenum cofactor cytidylyltransferase